jgi:hypothetical protein
MAGTTPARPAKAANAMLERCDSCREGEDSDDCCEECVHAVATTLFVKSDDDGRVIAAKVVKDAEFKELDEDGREWLIVAEFGGEDDGMPIGDTPSRMAAWAARDRIESDLRDVADDHADRLADENGFRENLATDERQEDHDATEHQEKEQEESLDRRHRRMGQRAEAVVPRW